MPEHGKLCVPAPLFLSRYLNTAQVPSTPHLPPRHHWRPFPLDTSNTAACTTIIHSNYTLFLASHCTESWHELTKPKRDFHGGTLLESAASCLLCSQQELKIQFASMIHSTAAFLLCRLTPHECKRQGAISIQCTQPNDLCGSFRFWIRYFEFHRFWFANLYQLGTRSRYGNGSFSTVRQIPLLLPVVYQMSPFQSHLSNTRYSRNETTSSSVMNYIQWFDNAGSIVDAVWCHHHSKA